MVWDWAVGGVTEEVPRTMGPECENYMTNRRRIIEAILFCLVFICVIRWAIKRLEPIQLPDAKELNKPHSGMRIALLLTMTLIFGIEMGFKLANRSVIFVLNPCHIQTLVQIYILAAKPSRTTTALFRIQMNNLNGAFLAYIFPEVECRTLPFEQATYWIQHALLYIIPVYILRSGLCQVEDFRDFNWVIIGVEFQLIYHFSVLNIFSMYTGINLNHMLCAAESDPFQGQNYRIAAVIHESILCPILNKLTVYLFAKPQSIQYSTKRKGASVSTMRSQQQHYEQLTLQSSPSSLSSSSSSTATRKVSQTQKLQQHKPPTTCNKLYMPEDGAPSQLIHRNSREQSTSSKYLQDDDFMLEQEAPASAEYRMPTTKID
ncbi:transmembrane protein 164 [Stomoxys calcitrans]|uniref:transmembrane protein 164 n=1 Tax=Stomoxys calcitrans TaxID=35570 RepID=UPI0027E35D8F|nr:transmembrane protein 164 [Stomoxys calcitrans]XP_059225771.1 transmembrane protein 164 [Stomoxys calcitrans]XP_059225772.1 transmembrane protein 164 [Stomoxys calcitrans]